LNEKNSFRWLQGYWQKTIIASGAAMLPLALCATPDRGSARAAATRCRCSIAITAEILILALII